MHAPPHLHYLPPPNNLTLDNGRPQSPLVVLVALQAKAGGNVGGAPPQPLAILVALTQRHPLNVRLHMGALCDEVGNGGKLSTCGRSSASFPPSHNSNQLHVR